MAIYETQKGFNRQALAYIDEMVVQGLLTDAIVAAANTVAGLRNFSFSGYEAGAHRFYEQYQKHIDRAEAIGVITDALIAPLTTVAGLEALFTAEDSTISITGNKSLVAA